MREENPPSWFPGIECAASAGSPRLLVAQLLGRGGDHQVCGGRCAEGRGRDTSLCWERVRFFAALSHYCILQSAWEDDGI